MHTKSRGWQELCTAFRRKEIGVRTVSADSSDDHVVTRVVSIGIIIIISVQCELFSVFLRRCGSLLKKKTGRGNRVFLRREQRLRSVLSSILVQSKEFVIVNEVSCGCLLSHWRQEHR
jgi:uncharacterized membrane protein (UPF0182 family)